MPRLTKNKNDARYLKNEYKIRKAIYELVKNRRLRIQTREICRKAGVKLPTFYWHYRNINDAIIKIEQELYNNFKGTIESLNKTNKLDQKTILTNLFIFIYKNRDYFAAFLFRGDYYLLNKILILIKPVLTSSWTSYGEAKDNALYKNYSLAIISIIQIWRKETDFDFKKADNYLVKLLQLSKNPTKYLGYMLR